MSSIITHINYYLPKINYSNENLKNKKSINSIIKKVGINKKFSAEENEYASDLAIKAVRNLINDYPDLRKSIDFLIFCTQSPDYILPSSSSKIQNEIFTDKKIGSLDISLGCSGFVYSLAVAQSFIHAGFSKKILIVTSDTYSKFINEDDISVRSIFGDAAVATIVSSTKKKNYRNFLPDFGTDGSGIFDLILPGSGLKPVEKTNDEARSKGINKEFRENQLSMDGTKMFTFALKAVPKTINKVLKKNKIKIEEIDLFIFHQANQFMLESIQTKLDICKEKLYIGLSGKGNTTSSSIPLALYDAAVQKKLKTNTKVLLCGFGVGLSWATSIIQIDEKLINNITRKN